MLNYKTGTLSKAEKSQVDFLLDEIVDVYGDFYTTKNRIRLMLRDNSHILYEDLKKKDKLIWGEEGILFVTGFSDPTYPRKYIKILARNEKDASQLIKSLNFNLPSEELFAKVKKNNIILRALQKNGFVFKGDRGAELLLYRKAKTTNFKVNKEGDK